MERQAGLGRSLEDVLDSLTPVEQDPASPGRVLFESDLRQQLDQLMSEVCDLRERVQELVALVPDDAALRVVPDPGAGKSEKKSKKHKKKKSGKHKAKQHRHDD
jgi:hypothetical protein